jgi:hypothetical protein
VRLPRDESEAYAWALEALSSFPGTGPCWRFNGELDAFVAPGRGRAVPVDLVEGLRAVEDPESSAR